MTRSHTHQNKTFTDILPTQYAVFKRKEIFVSQTDSHSHIATINPATEEIIRVFPAATPEQIETTIAHASAEFNSYRKTSFSQRAAWMHTTADLLETEADHIAQLMTTEMGKTLLSAKAEVHKCVKAFRFYANNAHSFLEDHSIDPTTVGATTAFSRYQPLGVILAVMPWNFPLWQVVRFAAPALMAGNVCLLKHASNVPQTALYLAQLISRGGFPPGCFQTLLIGGSAVERVLRHPHVAAATLTGSELAGRAVGSICGDEIKPSVLELGGSDPFIVMPSADLTQAIPAALTARIQNNGQSCIAAKRFIIHQEVYEEFLFGLTTKMTHLRIGDPCDPATDLGPLATQAGREEIDQLVSQAISQGATLHCGGHPLDRPGWFYTPTVLSDITSDMLIFTSEVFGPVAAVYCVEDLDQAIELANSTPFGLGSSVWTHDTYEMQQCISDIVAGQVFVNGMVSSHPELPFGGTKRSGYGRELAAEGIRAFCNLKTIWIGS